VAEKLDLSILGVNLTRLAFLAALLASCGPSPTSVAPAKAPPYAMTLGNTRRALFENEHVPASPKVEWDTNAGSGLRGTIILIDSTVLAATTNQQMLAFHRRDGRRHWDQRFNNGVTSTLLYDQNTVYVATDEYDGAVFALNTARGKRQWKRTVGAVRFTPLLDNSVIYVGTDAGTVTALRTEGGSQLWRVGLRAPIGETPLDAGDRIVVFTTSDSVYGLRKSDGAVAARGGTRASPSAAPAISGTTIIVPMQDSTIVGYDIKDFRELWRVRATSPVLTPPAVASNGDAYVASRDGNLYRIREGNAQLLANVGHSVSASLTLARDHILLGSYDGTVVAVNMNGQTVWQFSLNESVVAPVAVGDGSVYVPLLRGRIVKLR
jgi:outer membrane protein assembly factor BamB